MSQDNGPWTVLKLLQWTEQYFQRAGLDSPRLCAEVLLAHAMGCERIMLYTRFDQVPDEGILTAYRESVRRAGDHEPVAYLVGYREFYSLRFEVDHSVLVPRPETEQLVSDAVEHIRNLKGEAKMWDACTGSGCVAIAAACQVDYLTVLATDISDKAIEVAKRNAEKNEVSDRVIFTKADLLELPADCEITGPFDVITVNPPYVGENDPVGLETKHEPQNALFAGPDGMDCINRLVGQAAGHLNAGGIFVMEFGQGQADKVYYLLNKTGEFVDIEIKKDFQDIERSVKAVRK